MFFNAVREPELPATRAGERTEQALDEIGNGGKSNQAGNQDVPCIEVHRCLSSLVLHKYTLYDAREEEL